MNRWSVLNICWAAVALTGAALLAEGQPPANEDSVQTTVESNRRGLWHASIHAPSDEKQDDELKQSIHQLKSIQLPEKSGKTSTSQEPEPSGSLPSAATQPAEAATTQPSGLASETLEKLKRLAPRDVADPAALADTLFLGGYPQAAAHFYEMAAQKETDSEEKLWLLFQVANCYRKVDPQAATKARGELASANADCVWSSIAQVQEQLVQWRNTENLDALLKEIGTLDSD
jgi:hypothetical protein